MQQTLWGSEHPADPRPELVSDHRHWKDVLWNCWHLDKDLYGLLHGIRCGGAQLVLTQSSYRLMPGEWSESEWEDIRQRLEPVRGKLVRVFKLTRFGTVTKEKVLEEVFGG